MSSDDSNLEETKAQLQMIETALLADPDNADLLQLKSDLHTLLALLQPEADVDHNTASLDSGGDHEKSKDDDGASLARELQKLEGQKVRAPVSEGGSELGNAVILGVEEAAGRGREEVRVRLVFSLPTREALVPCQYYLDNRCRRAEADCRWSHGEVRRLGSLSEYREPDHSLLAPGSAVLARGEGGVWARGRVTQLLGEEVMVRLEVGGAEPELRTLEEVWPLEDSQDTEEEEQEAEAGVETFVPHEIGQSGLKFGEWEHHTRGLGSRLMLGMGWVVGAGLGARGGGRVEPVTARMYPAGKSLDWCMDMRDKYGDSVGQDVETIVKREAKEAQKRSKQRAEAEERRDNSAKSLFDFINVNLCTGQSSSSGVVKSGNSKPEKKKTLIKDETDESLKLKKFKMSEQVTRVEKELSKLQDSYSRHKLKDPVIAANVKGKIEEKTLELQRLKSAAKSLSKEEGSRKSKTKLSIF